MKLFFPVLFVLTSLLCQSQKIHKQSFKNKTLNSSINLSISDISILEGSLSYSKGQVDASYNEEEQIITARSPKGWDTNVSFDRKYSSLSGGIMRKIANNSYIIF